MRVADAGTIACSVLLAGAGCGLAPGLPAPSAFAMEVEQARTFEECDAVVRERPTQFYCHQFLAQKTRAWSEGIRHLEARLAADPDDHLALLALAILRAAIADPQSEEDLRGAAEALAAEKKYELEGFARIGLFYLFGEQRRMGEAAAEMENAQKALDACGSPLLAAYLEYHRGLDSYYQVDYAGAAVHFKNAGTMADALKDRHLSSWVYNGLGLCQASMGKPGEAVEDYRRSADLARALGDGFTEASSRYDAYDSAIDAGWAAADQERLYQEALDAARRSGNFKVQAELLFHKAQQDGPLEARLAMMRQALDVVRRVKDPIQITWMMRYTGSLLAGSGPSRRAEGEAMLDAAIELSRRSGLGAGVAMGLSRRAAIHMDAGERDRALAAWSDTLDAVEDVRDRQRDDEARTGFLSAWAGYYYKAAAYTLQAPGPGAAPDDVDRALTVIERMRARVLLDSLDAAGVATGGAPGDLQRRRAGTLVKIAAVQRRLFSPFLPDAERTASSRELDALENQERALRDEMARTDPSFASLRTPSLATIARLQQALRPDQAMLSFQSDTNPANAGWALVVTHDAVRTAAIPSRATLDNEVDLFLGVLERRDGSEAAGAARLYKDLLEELMSALPPAVTRLVIVPDGPLHGLPFDALRQDAAGEPLAVRFDIALAPSCSAWLHLTESRKSQAERPVLVMADPHLGTDPRRGGERSRPSVSRAATIATGLSLGPLPRARDEGRKMVRSLGGGSRMVEGAEATERFLKTADLSSYRMLHLAAHAVLDAQRPERSAVLLAPGSDDEDGLLQSREIVNLDLSGRVVILSACSSAAGTVVEGEGVMGLARAFFQAGAVGVVGSLWPLRDEEAATLVDAMAARLGRGASVGEALAGARRAAIRAGAPAADWGGLVVLGDGEFVPLPGGRAPSVGFPWLAAVAVMLCLAGIGAGLGLAAIRRRRRQGATAR